jgi:hypothetical protein
MKKLMRFASMYRSYRADGFPIIHSIKGAILWCGVLEVQ